MLSKNNIINLTPYTIVLEKANIVVPSIGKLYISKLYVPNEEFKMIDESFKFYEEKFVGETQIVLNNEANNKNIDYSKPVIIVLTRNDIFDIYRYDSLKNRVIEEVHKTLAIEKNNIHLAMLPKVAEENWFFHKVYKKRYVFTGYIIIEF